MFRFAHLLTFILFTASGYSQTVSPSNSNTTRLNSSQVLVAAHRACWSQGAPENSLSAINACIEAGVDIVEIDVRLSKDQVPLLLHDSALDRTTSGTGQVALQYWRDIQHLTLRNKKGGKSAPMTSQTVPSLAQALRLAKGKILLNLDVKANAYTQTFNVVQALGMERQVIIKTDHSPDAINHKTAPYLAHSLFMPIVRQCQPHKASQFCASRLSQRVNSFHTFSLIAFEVTYSDDAYLTEGVEAIENFPARLWVNTLSTHHAAGLTDHKALRHPDQVWGHLIDLGVNIIQTDYPGRLLSYLKIHQKKH